MSDTTLTKTEGKELSRQTGVGIHVKSVDEAILVAKTFAQSGLFKDAKDAAQCVAKILMGAEFGLTPASSMNAIHIVQGKMQMSGVMIAHLISSSRKFKYRKVEHTNEVCILEFFERDDDGKWESLGTERFDAKDATRQQTQNMTKFPKNMLFARCISNGAKFHTPEIFGGQPIYTEGEIEEPETRPTHPAATRADTIKQHIQERTAIGARQAPALEAPAPTEEEPTGNPLEEEASEWINSMDLSAEDKQWLVTFRTENENWASRFIEIRDGGVNNVSDLRSMLSGEDLFAS